MFTLCPDSLKFELARKLYWIGLLFTHKNGDFNAISVAKLRNVDL